MKIISGGQTGADQAGWRAAKAAGLETGGWMPRGFKTEDGWHPEFVELYGAREHESSAYPPRTKCNILASDATFIFAVDSQSRGTLLAVDIAAQFDKPCVVVKVNFQEQPIPEKRPIACAGWLCEKDIKILNVAGNRESAHPGIGQWVEQYLTRVFQIIKC